MSAIRYQLSDVSYQTSALMNRKPHRGDICITVGEAERSLRPGEEQRSLRLGEAQRNPRPERAAIRTGGAPQGRNTDRLPDASSLHGLT